MLLPNAPQGFRLLNWGAPPPQQPAVYPQLQYLQQQVQRLQYEVDQLIRSLPVPPPLPPLPPPPPAPVPPPPPPPPPPAPVPVANTYTVKAGDSLSKIAREQLGNGERWPEIFNLNRDKIDDPNLIYPGQVLKLPGRAEAPKPAPAPAPKPHNGKLQKPHVVSMPSPNQGSRPAGTKIDTIVLHHTASGGTAQDTGRFFQNAANQVSSHYIVGKDGTIVQSVPDDRRAWHAGESVFKGHEDVNDFSLGIEIVNRGDNKDPYTAKQYEALADLVAWMMQKYGVPMERITGHRHVALPVGRKVDPSDNFDWEHLRKLVRDRLK